MSVCSCMGIDQGRLLPDEEPVPRRLIDCRHEKPARTSEVPRSSLLIRTPSGPPDFLLVHSCVWSVRFVGLPNTTLFDKGDMCSFRLPVLGGFIRLRRGKVCTLFCAHPYIPIDSFGAPSSSRSSWRAVSFCPDPYPLCCNDVVLERVKI